MSRRGLILITALALAALPGGGEYVGMAVLTLLMPVYALLLASVFLFIFLLTSAIAVPIGQGILARRDIAEGGSAVEAEHRKAA